MMIERVVDQVMSDLTTPEIEDKNGDKINNIKYEKTLELSL